MRHLDNNARLILVLSQNTNGAFSTMIEPLKFPPSQKNNPDVFIIESLSIEDERLERYEGRATRDALKVASSCYHPFYYYVRTASELEQAIKIFRHSKCRYLHFSMHADENAVLTTLESIPNQDFAEMLKDKLHQRRVFFSACLLGAGFLGTSLFNANQGGLHSFVAPTHKVKFDKACPFWISFYSLILNEHIFGMNKNDMQVILKSLCPIFEMELNFSWFNSKEKKVVTDLIN
jgi:hypothetical protein